MINRLLFLSAGFLITIPNLLSAQLTGSHQTDWQRGNIPFNGSSNYVSLYNQTGLNFKKDGLDIRLRYESFETPISERNYGFLSQKMLRYRSEGFTIQVGNLYEMLGRGLLLRTYEITGAVYEDLAFRTRTGFYRDLEGVSLKYSSDIFDINLLHGKPLQNVFPPGLPQTLRRPDVLDGGQLGVTISPGQRVGILGLRHTTSDSTFSNYAGLFYAEEFENGFSFYSEWASGGSENDLFNPSQTAGYATLNYSAGGFGASLEYKNYNRFLLGSGFNDPPALIKETTYPVLNRQTHVLNSGGEEGWQFEAIRTADNGTQTVVNVTRLETRNGLEASYTEFFVEQSFEFSNASAKLFFDYADDGPKFQKNRFSAGTSVEGSLFGFWSGGMDVQGQQFFSRTFNESFENGYMALTLSRSGWFTAAAVAEISSDWLFTDRPDTFSVETSSRTWIGTSVTSLWSTQHRFSLFAGQRRGGPSCTSGICYEVLDFSGVEFKYNVNF